MSVRVFSSVTGKNTHKGSSEPIHVSYVNEHEYNLSPQGKYKSDRREEMKIAQYVLPLPHIRQKGAQNLTTKYVISTLTSCGTNGK